MVNGFPDGKTTSLFDIHTFVTWMMEIKQSCLTGSLSGCISPVELKKGLEIKIGTGDLSISPTQFTT